jgi:hypothetical protein
MARIQILELPTVYDGDQSETPFVLVIDESSYPTAEAYQTAVAWWGKLSIGIGAKDCIVTDDTIDIPANDVTAPVDDDFKAEVQQWAAGTNETIARLVEALSYPRKRPKRDGQETRLKLDDHEVRNAVPADARKMREQAGLD